MELRTRDLEHGFRSDGPALFSGISLTLAPGEGLLITGAPGSGKSTLLALLAGLLRARRGEIWLGGREVARCSEEQLSSLRARHMGLVFQDFRLIRGLNARENVELGLAPLGLPRREARGRALAALAEAGLSAHAETAVGLLSGGEQQRVALARALAKVPAVILADEPTANVDARSTEAVLTTLSAARARGATLAVATHDPTVRARSELFCQHLHFEDGRGHWA
jgi:putative ABC transport system ATP-binding protein